jgi:uncharacterized protein YcfJ
MNRKLNKLKYALGASAALIAFQAAAQITFYEGEGFRGRSFTTDRRVGNFERFGFNDRASSVVVDRGRWEVCEGERFEGRCVVLRRGSYDSLRGMGLDNRVSSVRPLERDRERVVSEAPEPLPAPTYEYRRRPNERLYEVPITSVRAVMGTPEQRCWVEQQPVNEPRTNVPGAVVGAIIGGIIGHEVVGGRNRDVGTVGGGTAGAIIGSQAGGGSVGSTRDVRRCEQVANQQPQYWDVTYNFRGVEHHAQTNEPPRSRTIVVNEQGVPRG